VCERDIRVIRGITEVLRTITAGIEAAHNYMGYYTYYD
jgi:hypothetical protein